MEFLFFSIQAIFFLVVAWYVLQVLADYKIFEKAGKPGWHCLIPFLNIVDEYDICWSNKMGLVFLICSIIGTAISKSTTEETSGYIVFLGAVAGIACLVIHIMQSIRLSKAFGRSTLFGIFLILFGPIARIVLGLGKSQYIGRP